jgi:hypothetical protein
MKILLVIEENGQIVSKDPVFDDEKSNIIIIFRKK